MDKLKELGFPELDLDQYDKLELYHNHVREVCESGQSSILRNLLADTSVECMRTLLQFQLDEGSTPLILACKNGHLELVKFMVERCGVNISQTGSVTFDGEDIEGAPPLWCAAAAGHVDVVRYLVNKGAYINKTTRSNSTPLRAACYDGHLKVVQFLVDRKADIEIANRHGHTCLMIACYRGHINVVRYLLDHGAQVNRQSTKGNTALHDGAESGKLDIVKLLLKRGSHITRDAYGQTALTAAAMTGHMSIVDYLIGSAFFKPNDQANALELLGATFVDKTHDHILAFRMWQKALDLRKRTGVEKKRHAEPVPAYNNAVEVCNHEECEVLTHDPDLTRMQALLIRERVLGYAHPETSFCIRFRGALYADGGDFERCMTLWLYTLETQTSRLDPLADGTMSSFVSFVELFAYVFVKGTDKVGTGDGIKDIFVETVLRVVELGVEEVIRHREAQQGKERKEEGDSPDIKKLLVALLHIVSLVNYVTPLSNASSSPASLRLQKILYRLVKMRVRTRDGSTLMHLACSQNSTGFLGRIRVSTFPSLGVARLLLKVGADPDARDNKRRTALHLVCQADPIHMSLVGALLAGGAHPDMCDEQHASPLDKLKDGGRGREVCPVANSSLKCLAARAIAHSERLTPDLYEGKVGRDLEDFIKMH